MQECIHSKFILDGEIVDCRQFRSLLIDQGISIYEVVRVIHGKILFARDHLLRLEQSVRLAGQETWYSLDTLQVMISHLPALNGIPEGNIKIVFNYMPDGRNKFLAYFVTHFYPDTEQYKKGIDLHSYHFTRTDPHKKIWRPKHRTAVQEYISKNLLYEVLLIDDHDRITEASKANIFFITGDTVTTPPIELVLPGITRKYILEICRDNGIPVREEIIQRNRLDSFEAAFITGTSPKVLPVSHIDKYRFNPDHPVLRLLMEKFDNFIDEVLHSRNGQL